MAKILIIDDSNLSRRMLRKILEELGHSVIEANDGLSALEMFVVQSPELVFLDLTMPNVNGLEVLENLLKVNPNGRVIIASADIQSSTKKIAMEKGATGYITKPFVLEDIKNYLNEILTEV